jgi:hypothetical protein
VKRIPLLSGLAFIALVVLSLGALASDGILYANGSATPSPFSPNGSNSLRLDIDWGIDTAVRINPLTGTQTDNFEVRSEVAFTLSSQTIQTLTGLSVSVSAPTAQQTVYWDGRDSQGNLAPEGTYEWVLTGHLVDLSAPILSNVSPANGTNFPETTSVTVSGNVNDINAVVTVNGETAAVSQSTGNWSVVVPVIYGSNVLTIRAADPSGNVSTQTIGIAVGVALGYDPGLLTGELHDPSFERTQEKWTYTSTGSTYGSTLDPAFDGAKTFRSTSNTLTYSGRTLSTTNFVTGIVPGHSHRLEVGWYASGTEWADNRLEINIEWYDSSDSLVSTSAAADLTLAAQSTWELKIVTATAPASAAKAKILIRWRRILRRSSRPSTGPRRRISSRSIPGSTTTRTPIHRRNTTSRSHRIPPSRRFSRKRRSRPPPRPRGPRRRFPRPRTPSSTGASERRPSSITSRRSRRLARSASIILSRILASKSGADRSSATPRPSGTNSTARQATSSARPAAPFSPAQRPFSSRARRLPSIAALRRGEKTTSSQSRPTAGIESAPGRARITPSLRLPTTAFDFRSTG